LSFDADVAVIGVGSIGSMALWRLAARGLHVHGFEQFGVGHDRSAAGGETRMFRTNSLKHASYVGLARESLGLWRELERSSGHRLLELCGELVMGADDAPGMVKAREHAREFDLRCESLDSDEVRRRYPQHRVRSTDSFLLDWDAGYLRADLAVVAAAHVAQNCGAVLHQYTGVDAIEPDADGVRVSAAGRVLRFRKAIVTAGPWTVPLVPALQGLIQVRRPVQAWFAVQNPQAFAPDRFPGFLRTGSDSYYGFPSVDGVTIKLGLSSDYNKLVEDQDQLERRVTLDEIARFREVAAEFFNDLYPEPVRVGAWMEGYTMDNQAIVGPLPDTPSVLVLSGFSGHGFKFASLMGEVAAELVDEGQTRRGLEFMSPARALAPWPQVAHA
jgi:sarcosine oxidase